MKPVDDLLLEMKAHVLECEKRQKIKKESPEEQERLARVKQRAEEEETEPGNYLCRCEICITGTCKSGWLEIKGAYRSQGHVRRHGEYEKFIHGN